MTVPKDLDKKLIFEVHFNDWGGAAGRLTKPWIENRLALFMSYTLKSLQIQTMQDFTCYVLYEPKTKGTILDQLGKYKSLPRNIRFVTPVEYKSNLAKEIQGYQRFYLIHLSSDDMYRKDFVEKLLSFSPKQETRALIPQYGYVYDSVQHRLGKFFFWLPSYGVTIYNVTSYLKNQVLEYSWRDALKIPKEYINVKDPIWINHVHAFNTGIWFDKVLSWKIKNIHDACDLEPWTDSIKPRAFFGPEITNPEEIKRILADFY